MIPQAHRSTPLSLRIVFAILIGISLMPALVLSLGGCNGMMHNMPSAANSSFAFVTNSGSGTVSAFTISNSGAMSPVSGSPFTAGVGSEFLAYDPVHKLLFVSNQGADSLSVFGVDTSSGKLGQISGSPVPTGARPTGVVADAAGRLVFVANQAANSISVFSISSGGGLTPVSGSPFPASSPFGLAINSSGTVLYASNFPDSSASDLNSVSAFSISSSGALTPLSSSPFPDANSAAGFAASIGILADPNGRFVFAADHMAEDVVAFRINSDGALTPTASLPTPATTCATSCHHNPLRLAVDPMDKFLYWTNVQNGTVSVFNINNGNLALVAETPAGAHPFGLAFDPTGSFLYVVNKADDTISGFSVNTSTGTLSPLSHFPFAEGQNAPTDIVIVPKM